MCKLGLTMVQHVPLPWSTMADPCLCQSSLTMVDHGQTLVISLPNHSTPWLETVFTLQPWRYHGCTCSIHPLAGKIVTQTSQGLFNSKYERKHEMDSGSTSSNMTPSCKWPILSLPIASEIEVGFKACLYFL